MTSNEKKIHEELKNLQNETDVSQELDKKILASLVNRDPQQQKEINPKKRVLRLLPYVAMVACLLILIPLGLTIKTSHFDNKNNGTIHQKELTVTDKSKAILIPDGKGGRALTFWVSVKNNTNKSEPFYVEFDVKDNWLSSQMGNNKFIVGQPIFGDKGELFTFKPNLTAGIGGTYSISNTVDENKLKEIIENNKAVEVRLLTKSNKVITTGFITKYTKDFNINGSNPASN